MMLNPSARNWTLALSVTGKFLNREKSMLMLPGPVNVLRPTFPNWPDAGFVKAAGLNHSWGPRPPGGIWETPGIALGRALPPVFEKSVLAVIVYGVPVVKESMPMICQPSAISFAAPLRLRPNGKS